MTTTQELSASPAGSLRSTGKRLDAALLFLLAVVIRCLPWSQVFSAGQVYLFDPDCYIRLRKIMVYLLAFPSPRVHDYFQGFPVGTGVISPPAMEYVIAALALPFRTVHDLQQSLAHLIAVIPPLIGGITVVILYRSLVSRIGRTPALLAGGLLALLPAHIETTVLGRFDNEMIEPLFFLLIFQLSMDARNGHGSTRRWIAAGVLSAVFLTLWRGAALPLVVIGLDLTAGIFMESPDDEPLRTAQGGVLMYLTATLLIAVICVSDIWGTAGVFSATIVSWFHVALFAAAALFLSAAVISARHGVRKQFGITCLGLLVAAALLIALTSRDALWLQLFSGGNSWLDSISQYQRPGGITGWLRNFGFTSLLVPLTIPFLLKTPSIPLPLRRQLIILGMYTLLLATLRERFSAYFALACAAMGGVAFHILANHIARRMSISDCAKKTWAAILLVVVLAPTIGFDTALARTGIAFPFRGDIEETMIWLREHTPPAGDPLRPQQFPDYGVMARWDYGGWIETVAQRPSVATNYGTETHGMAEAASFMLARNDDEMAAVLRKNGVRYLIVDKVIGDIPMYARLIGRQGHFFDRQPGNGNAYSPTAEAFDLVSSRLFFADGSQRMLGGFTFRAVEGVRMVHESPSNAKVGGFPWEVKRLKIYEFCPGTTIIVHARPGETVTISQPIETNQGRRFDYVNEKTASADGVVRFTLVYSRRQGPDSVGATGPALITAGSRHADINPSSDTPADTVYHIRLN
ncbi:STT3 domain-containing protein [Geobacter sp. AOG1]|uniref:STT3 domain-containing protein n=1 Tax=Geobacter sp. AOG1 TaxID=1566346 RepID=UPI001CC5A609|nr:STT3 domain-containing protein [Geobacter sp. AOG1]GFE57745.1 hypothetical protein AOG1_16250 [Geobacter sp. AOG1]